MKKYIIIALGALLCFAAGCASGAGSASNAEPGTLPDPTPPPTPDPAPVSTPTPPADDEPVPDIITGKIEMEDGGIITFELYPDIAPQAVRNFVSLARQGFYDGIRFHRIMHGFMIQGGCPYSRDPNEGDPGTGNPGYTIFGEFADNGFANGLNHTRGVMSMARGPHNYNSAGSQFFICHANASGLNGGYAAFGMVTDGMDVVDKIAETPNNGPNGSVALEDMPIIKTITIDGNFTMEEPDKIPR